jgi:formamidopyrimidine-DNA glycosylase
MPELPEVEALRRLLSPRIRGRIVREVLILKPRLVRPHAPSAVTAPLQGARIEQLERRAKHLVFRFTGRRGDPLTLLLHLGMTGRIRLCGIDAPLPAHAAAVFDLGTDRMVMEDIRQFGRITLDTTVLEGLGQEPLDRPFTVDALGEVLAGSSQPVKVRLMDQSRVVGIGNIYASEALFLSRISPLRPAGSIRPEELLALHSALRATLESAIERNLAAAREGRSLFYTVLAEDGPTGGSAAEFQVYDKAGAPCPRCEDVIAKCVQAGRSTYFCAACQE